MTAHALTENDFREMATMFGPSIAAAIDGALHRTDGKAPDEAAADHIVGLLVEADNPLVREVLKRGYHVDDEVVSKIGFFGRMVCLYAIGSATFPDQSPLQIIHSLIGHLLAAGVPYSAAAMSPAGRH